MGEVSFLETLRDEINQTPKRRQELLCELGEVLGRTVVAYFTSFKYAVTIDQSDVDMLEEVLRSTKISNGLCLVLNSPGGDSVAAERIIRICRVYSDNVFDVLIPRRAKSAATMIALGADRIFMGETSALGRIDPQLVTIEVDGTSTVLPADVVIKSYDELLGKAASIDGHLEPYLQQLSRYDPREIERLRRAVRLAEDIALRCLKQGNFAGMSKQAIKKKIGIFLKPTITKAHVREVFFDEVQKIGLNVELIRHDDPIWGIVSELCLRADYFVSSDYCKLIESPEHHFSLPWHEEAKK
jgi:hypothetical protein